MGGKSGGFLASASNRNAATCNLQKRKLKGKKVGKGITTKQASKRQVADEKTVGNSHPTVSAENFFATEVPDDEGIRYPVHSLKSSRASSYHFSFDSSASRTSRSEEDVKTYQTMVRKLNV